MEGKGMTMDEQNETVTIAISREDANVIYRIMKQLGHGAIKTFNSTCKFCGKSIEMMSNDGGVSWKPTSIKTGKVHKCKAGKKHYRELSERSHHHEH